MGGLIITVGGWIYCNLCFCDNIGSANTVLLWLSPEACEGARMNFDWRMVRERHPWVFTSIVLGKKLRTKVGLLLAVACVADGLILWEPPYDLSLLNRWILAGIALIGVGVAFRLAALGYLKKKEILATGGVYSLCRHPLYFGSILITYGFCCLLNDWVNYVVATAYFLVFYTLTIVWEEIRLEERYGTQHCQYASRTPALVPYGRFVPCEFKLGIAMRKGGGLLLGLIVTLLVADEIMAKMMG